MILSTLHLCLQVETSQGLAANTIQLCASLLKHKDMRIRSKAAQVMFDLSLPLEGKETCCTCGCIPLLLELLTDQDSDTLAQATASLMRYHFPTLTSLPTSPHLLPSPSHHFTSSLTLTLTPLHLISYPHPHTTSPHLLPSPSHHFTSPSHHFTSSLTLTLTPLHLISYPHPHTTSPHLLPHLTPLHLISYPHPHTTSPHLLPSPSPSHHFTSSLTLTLTPLHLISYPHPHPHTTSPAQPFSIAVITKAKHTMVEQGAIPLLASQLQHTSSEVRLNTIKVRVHLLSC